MYSCNVCMCTHVCVSSNPQLVKLMIRPGITDYFTYINSDTESYTYCDKIKTISKIPNILCHLNCVLI